MSRKIYNSPIPYSHSSLENLCWIYVWQRVFFLYMGTVKFIYWCWERNVFRMRMLQNIYITDAYIHLKAEMQWICLSMFNKYYNILFFKKNWTTGGFFLNVVDILCIYIYNIHALITMFHGFFLQYEKKYIKQPREIS